MQNKKNALVVIRPIPIMNNVLDGARSTLTTSQFEI